MPTEDADRVTARPYRYLAAVAATGLVAAVTAGCSEPQLPEGPVEEANGEVPQPDDEGDDLARDQLSAALADLHEALATAEDELRSAADAGSLTAVRSAAERGRDRLLDDGTGPAAVLPAVSPERGSSGERDDLLSATLASARDVGGGSGDAVVALLRDVAGDLGAWERDAEGVIASADRVASRSGDPDALTDDVLELGGEATRALAWTIFALDAGDRGTATTAASRAASHLELARLAIEDLQPSLLRDGAGGEGGA